jgi:Outer membrane protein/protective antigen OMA87
LFNIAAGSSSQILLEQGQTTKSQITLGIANDTRDNPFLTRVGHRISFTPYVSGGFLAAANKSSDFRWRRANTSTFGKMQSCSSADRRPRSTGGAMANRFGSFDRLFLGGSNDLRGFDYRDVSPRDINGEPLGGQSLAAFTAEVTMPIIEKARFAVFYDTGFVNVKPWNFDTSDVVSDAGIGLRLDLPIGPLRIDYGIPIQKGPYKDAGSGKFNFNVGYQF